MKLIELHVHSFSLRYQFRYRQLTGYDVFDYIKEMASLGFTGVNISANGVGFRDLCGDTAEHFLRVREAAEQFQMHLEIDTSNTDIENMTRMIGVAKNCGADTLRTYTKYHGELVDLVKWTIRDLRGIADLAESNEITVVLENHEDFTGPVLAEILSMVDHPRVRALYDYGNSQMVGEDPMDALNAMRPFIARVHAKDHVLVQGPNGPVVQGVPFGSGLLPVGKITDALYDGGVRRFCYENVWSYFAPLKCQVANLPQTACFVFDNPERFLDGDALDPVFAIVAERTAFEDGLKNFIGMLNAGGYGIAR